MSCGRDCSDQVVVAEQPGRQQCFRIRLNFEESNFVDNASGLLGIMNYKSYISLEIVSACMESDHTCCHNPLQEKNVINFDLDVGPGRKTFSGCIST